MRFDGLEPWLGAGLLVGLLLWKRDEIQVAGQEVIDVFARGKRLTVTKPDAQGVIPDDPQDLAAQAAAVLGRDVPLDVYSLARMGRSEGVDGMEYRMHVALNDLSDLQDHYGTVVYSSISALMLHSKRAAADGHYSIQALGKRYATTQDPYEGDLLLAEKVLGDRLLNNLDLALGAIKFADIDGFGGAQAGTPEYDDLLSSWTSEGLVPFSLPSVSPNLVFFRRA